MLLTGKIKTLINSGSPDYEICGQATAALSLTNMTFRMSISRENLSEQTIVNTTDLSTLIVGGLPYATYNYGNYDLKFTDFKLDVASSSFQAKVEVFYAGTTDVVTWERFYIYIGISVTGYQSFSNTFELYNYDVGNTTGTSGFTASTGNTNFEIILVNNTNNLDIYGRQTRAAASLMVLRRPFTTEVHAYSMIGTQGILSYADDNSVNLGNGKHIQIFKDADSFIQQTINLSSDYCVASAMALKATWYPDFITSYSSDQTCDNCTNDIANTTASYYRDASNTSIFNIHGVPYFLSEFMDEKITIDILNYKSEVINTTTTTSNLTYNNWVNSPATYTTPTTFNFIPSIIGDNVISFTNLWCYIGSTTVELVKCIYNYDLTTCHWFVVETTLDCNIYKLTNCCANDITVEVQQMQDDKSFVVISTTPIVSFANVNITFAEDSIYVLKITHPISGISYYSLPIFCGFQQCYLDKLAFILCNKVTENNCAEVKHYDFNAFTINAHTLALLLNKEFNYNFIYTSLPQDKVDDLYTIKTFIDRMNEYCSCIDESPCLPCNQ